MLEPEIWTLPDKKDTPTEAILVQVLWGSQITSVLNLKHVPEDSFLLMSSWPRTTAWEIQGLSIEAAIGIFLNGHADKLSFKYLS